MSDPLPYIAVLGGTGKEGRALAARLAAAGYRVAIGSRDPDRARDCAAAITARVDCTGPMQVAGMTLADAARGADIVILTVPHGAQLATLELVREYLAGKILVDVTVPLVPPKVSIVQLPAAGSAVVEAQRLLGAGTRVVSAFQNISHERLEQIDQPVGCDVLVCGDDKEAREQVVRLAQSMGMAAWHAGVLANSAASEALTSVLIYMNVHYKAHGAGIQIIGVK